MQDDMIETLRMVNDVETVVCTLPEDGLVESLGLMAKDEIRLRVVTSEPLPVTTGDYTRVDGKEYTLNREADVEKLSGVEYKYDMILESPLYNLLDKLYMNTLTNQSKFYLTGTLRDFVTLLVTNANILDPGWTIGNVTETEKKNLNFESISCREVLNRLSSEFSVEYHVPGREINFVEKIENNTGLVFEQGRDKGLYSITRQNVDTDNTVTRAFLFGGTRNLPEKYKAEGRLRVPEKYIEDLSEYKKVVERDVHFDDVYPRFNGSVDSVSGDHFNVITCAAIDFDINKQLLPGIKAKINFVTGDLTGEDFELTYNHARKEVTIIRKEDSMALEGSDGNKPLVPSASRKPVPGDKFNFTEIVMPESYVTRAEAELREKGRKWLDFYKRLRVKYTLDIDSRYTRRNNVVIHPGDIITVKTPESVDRKLRVISVERDHGTGKISCEVSNYLPESWERYIEGKIQDAKNGVDIVRSEVLYDINATKEWVARYFGRLADDMENGQAIVWDDVLKVLKTIATVPDAFRWAGHLFDSYLNQAVKTDSDVIHKTVTAQRLIEEDAGAGTPLMQELIGNLGDLENVDPEADTALTGSILVKGVTTWSPMFPTFSSVDNYNNLLMPVFNTLTRQWIFIAVPGGVIVPPPGGFPYVFPVTL